MTHEFKVGDKVIVLPNGSKVSAYNPFDVVTIKSFYERNPMIQVWKDGNDFTQSLYQHEVNPLPIPYSQLDEE